MEKISPISKKKSASKKATEAQDAPVAEATTNAAENNLEETINALLSKKINQPLRPHQKTIERC